MRVSFASQFGTELPNISGSNILIACSGGLDSSVLLHLMTTQNCQLGVAHLNYRLRGTDSKADEKFVAALAKQYDLPFHLKTTDTAVLVENSKDSLQMVARDLRYNWFAQLCEDHHYDFVMTAHHADDALETLLMHLERGSGLKGLLGIPKQNGNILRPLLDYSKEDILDYAKSFDLNWREDSSNQTNAYKRNELRNLVIPVLKKSLPNIVAQSRISQNHLKQSEQLVAAYLASLKGKVWTQNQNELQIQLNALMQLPESEAVLFHLLAPYGFTDWSKIYQLPGAESGKTIAAPGYRLLKDRDFLIMTPTATNDQEKYWIEPKQDQAHLPIKFRFEIKSQLEPVDSSSIFVDADRLQFPLCLRNWQAGDRFIPFGMQGSKKISDYLIDQKISRFEKEKIWLLCSDKKIVWLLGHRADDRFKVTEKTSNLLKITWVK